MDLDALHAAAVVGAAHDAPVAALRRAARFALLEKIRADPTMAEVLIEGAEYLRCELHLAAGAR